MLRSCPLRPHTLRKHKIWSAHAIARFSQTSQLWVDTPILPSRRTQKPSDRLLSSAQQRKNNASTSSKKTKHASERRLSQGLVNEEVAKKKAHSTDSKRDTRRTRHIITVDPSTPTEVSSTVQIVTRSAAAMIASIGKALWNISVGGVQTSSPVPAKVTEKKTRQTIQTSPKIPKYSKATTHLETERSKSEGEIQKSSIELSKNAGRRGRRRRAKSRSAKRLEPQTSQASRKIDVRPTCSPAEKIAGRQPLGLSNSTWPKNVNLSKLESESTAATSATVLKSLKASDVGLKSFDIVQPPVRNLSYDLDRVLFKKGVYNLQDLRTGVFNFDHYLHDIMPVDEFDFDSLGAFITSSKDVHLQSIAKSHNKRYVGSTSSMSSVLAHFHYLLSNFRPLNLKAISRGYRDPLDSFTYLLRIPASIYLKYKDGVYAIDADKEFDRGTVLSQLGHSLEKLLTLPKDVYEQYRKSNSEKVSQKLKDTPESYHYSSTGNFLFRSQLDGHHDWLPGTGIFDIKTRACISVRMNQDNFKDMSGYQITGLHGTWESYEREYVDMLRSTMLKYSMQVRLGRMDGIFVAYHNTEQIFGFQYIPLSEMDLALHGQENLALGDQEFKLSVQMFSDLLDSVTQQFPEQSIRLVFETVRGDKDIQPEMRIYAEPMDIKTMDEVQQKEAEEGVKELKQELLHASAARDLTVKDSAESETVTRSDDNDSTTELNRQSITSVKISHTTEEANLSAEALGTSTIEQQTRNGDDLMDNDLKKPLTTGADPIESETLMQESISEQPMINEGDVVLQDSEISLASDTDVVEETENVYTQEETQDCLQEDSTLLDDTIAMNAVIIEPETEETANCVEKALEVLDIASEDTSDSKSLTSTLQKSADTSASYDMATRYPQAAEIFFPDQATMDSIYPLAASLGLYFGLRDFGRSQPNRGLLRRRTLLKLRSQLLLEASQSRDPLDLMAMKIQISIESFWEDLQVSEGIKALSDFTIKSHSAASLKMWQDFIDNQIKMYNTAIKQPQQYYAELAKHGKDIPPWVQRVLYYSVIQPYQNSHVANQLVNKWWHIFSSSSLAIKLALLEKLDLYGPLKVTPGIATDKDAAIDYLIKQYRCLSQNEGGKVKRDEEEKVKRNSLLAYTLTASHIVNGQKVKEVSNINYTATWPLPQSKHKDNPNPPEADRDWQVNYTLQEIPNEKAKKMYESAKAERRAKFNEMETKDSGKRTFENILVKLSEKGRQNSSNLDQVISGVVKEVGSSGGKSGS